MKKYLITNNYWYYDEFDLCNICVVDTIEKAEELVKEFNILKECLKLQKGYSIFIDKDCIELISEYITAKIELHDAIKIFISEKRFEDFKQVLADKQELYFDEITHFEFLNCSMNRNTLHEKLCNHEYASLDIEEIEYMN